MLAHLFLIESSSKLLVTRIGIKAQKSSISSLWFPWPIYLFFEMRFDLGTLDSGERMLLFGLLVHLSEKLAKTVRQKQTRPVLFITIRSDTNNQNFSIIFMS